MQAIIPVAGSASRLAAITDFPKCLLTVNGQSLLAHTLEQALALGCSSAVLVVRDDEVPERMGQQYQDLPLHYAVQPQPLGLGHAMQQAAQAVAGEPQFLFFLGDFWRPRPLSRETCRLFREGHSPLVLVSSRPQADMSALAAVVTDDRDCVIRIEEKAEHPPTNWAEAGIYRFPGAIMDAPQVVTPQQGITLQAMENWLIEQGWPLMAVRDASPWININEPEDLFRARAWAEQVDAHYGRSMPWPVF